MDEETERFQIAIGEHGDASVAVLVDSATGRSWWCRPGAEGPATWQPIGFAADAPAAPAPIPPPAPEKPARAPRKRAAGARGPGRRAPLRRPPVRRG